MLAVWVALCFAARQPVESWVRPDLFLITDPLVAALTMGASGLVVGTLAWSLVLVALTLVAGRAFCGWICPLGTLMDLAAHVAKPVVRLSDATHRRLQHVKYYLLAVFAAAALFSAQWLYLLDPLVLVTRAAETGLIPVFAALVPKGWLSPELTLAHTSIELLPVALFFGVLGLVAVTPRFYCRYLCPLGAFYGALSRFALLRRRVSGCNGCVTNPEGKRCFNTCRMGAVPTNVHYSQSHECIRCFSSQSGCLSQAISFELVAPRLTRKDEALDVGRRQFLVASGAGLAAAPFVSLARPSALASNEIVRPPRVASEAAFTDACVRCGLCVEACPTQTLQLSFLSAGVAGFWTPVITPTVGGCKADCNACSVVCPTDAIPRFAKDEGDKWSVKMGTVTLEKSRCICFTEESKCAECIDVCPTKAFVVEPAGDETPRRPHAIDYQRCVGCGLCETKCRQIVYGAPAVVLRAHGRGEPTSLGQEPTASFSEKTYASE